MSEPASAPAALADRPGPAPGLLVVDLAAGFGGAERRALEETAELHRRGEQVRLVAHQGTPLAAAAQRRGLPVVPVGGRKYDPRALVQMRRVLAEHPGWAVETHSTWSRACVLGAGGPSGPALATVHSTPAQSESPLSARLWHVPVLRLATRRGWRVVAVSTSVADHLVDDLGLPAGRVSTIWSGIEPADDEAAGRHRGLLRRELGIDDEAPVVAVVGRLVAVKQVPAVVEAFGGVLRRVPQAHLLLVGDGPELGPVLRAIGALAPEDRDQVHLLGRRDDVEQVMLDSDLLVLASTTEGLPMTVLEAAERRLPVLSTDVGSVREALTGDGVALLPPGAETDPRLSALLAEAAADLLTDEARRTRLAAVAHDRVRERFGLDRMATTVLEATRAPDGR